jgi:hypothetical protein
VIVPVQTDARIDLPAFVAYLEEHLDIHSDESILAAAPSLAALANDRAWLPRYLATAPDPGFERRNAYDTSVLIPHIDLTRGFMIRVVAWPAGTIPPLSPSAGPDNLYERESGTVAHTHDFSLLTVGYLGSGYETDVFDVPPLTGEIGDRVDLRPRGRYRLAQGTVMFYPAYRVAHIQHPPEAYSISLNLIVRGPDRFADQYFYDVHDQRLIRRIGGANDNRRALLAMAAMYPSPTFIPALDALARHPAARVREQAHEALARCRHVQTS